MAKVYQVWLSTLIGAALFGSLLSLAIVWGSKIVQSHGIDESSASTASLMIWLCMGIGAIFMDKFSNMMKSRKNVLLISSGLFSLALIALLYLEANVYVAGTLIFIMGFI